MCTCTELRNALHEADEPGLILFDVLPKLKSIICAGNGPLLEKIGGCWYLGDDFHEADELGLVFDDGALRLEHRERPLDVFDLPGGGSISRRRANVAHVSQPRPDSGLGFEVKVLKGF